MIPLKVTARGNFLSQIEERIRLWQDKKIAARLVADESVRWWYWQEHGTAGQGSKAGASYPIVPVNAEALSFPGPGGKQVVVSKVEHHGIKARRIVSKVLPDIQKEVNANIAQAFAKGAMFDPAVLQEYIIEAAEMAKSLIMQSIEVQLTGHRPDGKLDGQSPSSVFDAGTKVVDNSSGGG